jgi:hypothetical protein
MARTTVESPSSIRSCDKVQSPTPAFGSASKRSVSLPKKPHPRLLPHQSRRPTPTAVPSGVPATVPIPTKSSGQSLPRHRPHSLASHSPANPCPGEACLIAEQHLSKRPRTLPFEKPFVPIREIRGSPFCTLPRIQPPPQKPRSPQPHPLPQIRKTIRIHPRPPPPPVHRSSPAPAPTSTFHPRPKTRRPQLRPPPRHSANRILASTFSSRVPFPRNVPDTGRISP